MGLINFLIGAAIFLAAIVTTLFTYNGLTEDVMNATTIQMVGYITGSLVVGAFSAALWTAVLHIGPKALVMKKWATLSWVVISILVAGPFITATSTIFNAIASTGDAANRRAVLVSAREAGDILSKTVKDISGLGELASAYRNKGLHYVNVLAPKARRGEITGAAGPGGLMLALESSGTQMISFADSAALRLEELPALHKRGREVITKISDLANEQSSPFNLLRPKIAALRSDLKAILTQMESIISLESIETFTTDSLGFLALTNISRRKNIAGKQAAFLKQQRGMLSGMARQINAKATAIIANMPKTKNLIKMATTESALWQHMREFLPKISFAILLDYIPLALFPVKAFCEYWKRDSDPFDDLTVGEILAAHKAIQALGDDLSRQLFLSPPPKPFDREPPMSADEELKIIDAIFEQSRSNRPTNGDARKS